ncbi:gastrula zinc finger protein XlCGF17.1 [Apostichopus japonicus]|uniref:Gastrula zinc finger protein XlCGF17.1 n=1 Tax=Stichopus japonicus TaxID=307972 RepID=A0A2G8L3I8_STIJA|nr:gastrula zinc finger protein XlCGF17.1 [Apostichopus japonicus]
MKTHAGEFPFKCKFCHEQCNDSHDLHEHQQTHILELERPFQCAFCESNYKYKHDVKHHEIKHVGGESFHCQFCGKGFYKKSVRGLMRENTEQECKNLLKKASFFFFFIGQGFLSVLVSFSSNGHLTKRIPCLPNGVLLITGRT